MSRYLLDTSIASPVINGDAAVASRLRSLEPTDHLYLSVVSEGELTYGAIRKESPKRDRLLAAIAEVLAELEDVLAVTRVVAQSYGHLKTELASRGTPIPDNDLWIASTAAAHDMILVAHDEHFTRIPGLKLEDWLA